MTSRADRRARQESQRTAKALSSMSPDSSTTIILVRHGETQWNKTHRLQGQLLPGPDLTLHGIEQAQSLAKKLASSTELQSNTTEIQQQSDTIAAIISSDLVRAQHTASIIANHLYLNNNHPILIKLDPNLRERHLGSLQGLSFNQAKEQCPEAYAALIGRDIQATIPGGGESLASMQERVVKSLESIAKTYRGGNVIVVTHGGVLHAVYRKCTANNSSSPLVSNCSMSTIRIDSDKKLWALVDWNVSTSSNDDDDDAFGGGAGGG